MVLGSAQMEDNEPHKVKHFFNSVKTFLQVSDSFSLVFTYFKQSCFGWSYIQK